MVYGKHKFTLADKMRFASTIEYSKYVNVQNGAAWNVH